MKLKKNKTPKNQKHTPIKLIFDADPLIKAQKET